MIKIGIIGANGFLGIELIRLLKTHPKVVISKILSRNVLINDEFPHLTSFYLQETLTENIEEFNNLDLVFICLPHGKSTEYVKKLINNTKIIDLGADYRISDVNEFKKYYDSKLDEGIQKKFTYGFIEKNFDQIVSSSYIANPGCFAIAAQLSLLPIYELCSHVSISAITGSSGGGKTPTTKNHHSIRSKDIFSYNINKHRHLAEILQSYPNLRNDISFVPMSGPFTRGIYLIAHVSLNDKKSKNYIKELFINEFEDDPFIRIQQNIKLSNVSGSNYCDISINATNDKNYIIEVCIDNLGKGASGNAIECMNIMFKFNRDEGLKNLVPFYI